MGGRPSNLRSRASSSSSISAWSVDFSVWLVNVFWGYEREVYVGNVRYLVKKKEVGMLVYSTRTRDEGTDLLDGYMTLLSGSRAWNGRAIVVVSTKCSGMSKRGALLRGGGNYGISAIVTIYDDETYYSDSSS